MFYLAWDVNYNFIITRHQFWPWWGFSDWNAKTEKSAPNCNSVKRQKVSKWYEKPNLAYWDRRVCYIERQKITGYTLILSIATGKRQKATKIKIQTKLAIITRDETSNITFFVKY